MLSTRSLGRLTCAAAALTAMQLARPARAAPTDDEIQAARDLFSEAVQDEDADRWDEALDKLTRVSKVKLTAGVTYHLALCHEHLGQLATALATYRDAQDEATAADAQDVLRLVGPQLESLTPRVPHLTLQLEPGLRNPTVMLDGEALPASRLDVALAVDPGLHHIEASAPGRAGSNETVEIHEGDATVFRVSLPVLAIRQDAVAPEPNAVPSRAPSPSPVDGIVAATGAGILAGLGIGAFVAGGNAHGDAVRECAERTTSCESLIQTVRTWDWTALGAWGGAAASATLAALLLTRHSSEEGGARIGGAHVFVGPGSLGVVGSF
jgi:hypothetical protein